MTALSVVLGELWVESQTSLMKIRNALLSSVTLGFAWCHCDSVWLSGMTTYRPHKAVYQARNVAALRMLDVPSPLRLRALVVLGACLSWSDPCQEPLTHFYNAVHFPDHPYTINYMFLTYNGTDDSYMSLSVLHLCSWYCMCCYYCWFVALSLWLSSNLHGLLWSLKVQQWSDMWWMILKGCFNGGLFEPSNMPRAVNYRMSLTFTGSRVVNRFISETQQVLYKISKLFGIIPCTNSDYSVLK